VASSQAGPPAPPGRRQQGQGPGIVIARIFGIPVHVSASWFVIAGVFIIMFAQNGDSALTGTARYAVAAAFVLLLYVSVLIHELSHSIVARGFGLPVRRILLYPLGGVSEIEQEPQTPMREFLVSAAGPVLSLVLGYASLGLTKVVDEGSIPWIVLRQVMVANFIVAIFNSLPGLPLDGGRMLRAIIWKLTGRPPVATIVAAWVGRALAIALLVAIPLRIAPALGGSVTSIIWVAVIAAFMWTGAGQAIKATKFRQRLRELQARKLARRAISVLASTPLSEAIRQADESRALAVVVVDNDSKPIAILNEAAVTATPPQRRPWIEAGTLARSIEPELVLPADLSGMALLEAMRKAPASEYLLVEPSGQVYGVLAARDVDGVFSGILTTGG
jgi:Zn-dependent protease